VLRPFIALLATVLLLALPGAALAQSAGDDQYADPFGDTQQPSDGGQSDGDRSVDDGGSTSQPSAPAPTPDPAPSAAETSATASDGATLPRTGFEAVLLLAAAFPLLLGGIALRRVAS
jgi:hypothetical protein